MRIMEIEPIVSTNLIDSEKWPLHFGPIISTYLIDAEKWAIESANFNVTLRHYSHALYQHYRLLVSECSQASILTNCARSTKWM